MQGLRLGPAVFKFTPKADCVVIEVSAGASGEEEGGGGEAPGF